MTLTEFLTARFDEEEMDARRATRSRSGALGDPIEGHWGAEVDWTGRSNGWVLTSAITDSPDLRAVFAPVAAGSEEDDDEHDGHVAVATEAEVRHIVRHDPARVLADIAAKRRIVELRYSWNLQAEGVPEPPFGPILKTQVVTADTILRTLASVYAEHPDFREEWRA